MVGVTIGDYHTWKDWGLILQEVTVSSPEKKQYIVDIPGADGVLDLSSFLTNGDEKFENRIIRLKLAAETPSYTSMFLKASKILNLIQGKKKKIILDDDRSYYYIGTCFIDKDRINPMITTFEIEIDIEPYKYERFSSLEKWVWDVFCFEDGIIRNYKDLQVKGTRTLLIPGRRKKVVPVFECSEAMKLEYDGQSYDLPVGKSKILDLELGTGEHFLTFTGEGIVSVDYRGGCL